MTTEMKTENVKASDIKLGDMVMYDGEPTRVWQALPVYGSDMVKLYDTSNHPFTIVREDEMVERVVE